MSAGHGHGAVPCYTFTPVFMLLCLHFINPTPFEALLRPPFLLWFRPKLGEFFPDLNYTGREGVSLSNQRTIILGHDFFFSRD